jgi:transposase
VTREECNAFIDSPEGATLLKRIRSIHQNPEIDTKSDAVCLALQAIGIEPTARIVAGIAAFTTRMPHGVALMAMVGRTDETSSPEDPHSVN